MLTLVPSKDFHTIAVEVNGNVEEEDMEKLDKAIQEKFEDKGTFNVYAMVYDFDGLSLQAAAKEVKIDVHRWSQYAKMAVLSDNKKLQGMTEASGLMPGIKTKHFNLNESEEAWEWLQA
ncbi:STAS/SEC14 domain-containing protein [Planococcus sp. YIM B11945]|uniref:STAS/SEC14 domain-containing protein n=1 Tax=Planococcus sp. YIM B11945 TaxID=3435410 RepID=UPI003D7CCD54